MGYILNLNWQREKVKSDVYTYKIDKKTLDHSKEKPIENLETGGDYGARKNNPGHQRAFKVSRDR
jgi:hypothetical protein